MCQYTEHTARLENISGTVKTSVIIFSLSSCSKPVEGLFSLIFFSEEQRWYFEACLQNKMKVSAVLDSVDFHCMGKNVKSL